MPTNIGQFKDLLQETLGNVELSLEMTNFLLDSGRREIEKRINGYWMTVTTDFLLTAGLSEYPITSGTIGRSAFKDIWFLAFREQGISKWDPLPHRGYEVLNSKYSSSEKGPLKEAAVDNITMFFFPTPDKPYQVRMHAFEWQTNPTDNVGTSDELMDRFPEAMLFGATAVGTQLLTKNSQLAKPWIDLLSAQIPVIAAYSNSRLKRTA